jgi:hypothetical protein
VLVLAHGALDLARDETRVVARARQHKNEGLRPLDALDDQVAVGAARAHIARRDPAFEVVLFQLIGDFLRLLEIVLGVADKRRESGRLFGREGRRLL